MLEQNYQKMLKVDMERTGLTQQEVELIYKEFSVLVEMFGSATEKEKVWILEDIEKLVRKLKRF